MGLKNSDFKSGLDVKSGVVKLSRINITKACKNLGLKQLGCLIRNVVKSGDENAVVHCT